MAKHGKKYRAAVAQIDPARLYSGREAVKLAKETCFTSFDSTVEVHLRLGVDPRHADQQVRDVVVLPHGLGKKVRVNVFTEGESARLAREAGADFITDTDEEIKKIQDGWTDWEVSIATPEMMGRVGRLGRILGVRGLMPNPRSGTVVPADDLPRAIREAKAGRVEFRVDKTANLHVPIGKASFTEDMLAENLQALVDAVNKARPASAKGTYVKKVAVATTMGPGIRVDPRVMTEGVG
ncbi:MAG: 50S ribosomal protein L1 [Chloroflexi bacterium]|nr:50S ribosomal protein L1 [Chloroflexota bacterium]